MVWRRKRPGLNFCGDPRFGLEIKKSLVDIPFPRGESLNSTHKNTQDRLDKSRYALAEARLNMCHQ